MTSSFLELFNYLIKRNGNHFVSWYKPYCANKSFCQIELMVAFVQLFPSDYFDFAVKGLLDESSILGYVPRSSEKRKSLEKEDQN